MPNKTVKFEGKSYSVPEDTSDDELNQIFMAKSPAPSTPTHGEAQKDYAIQHPTFVDKGLVEAPSASDKFRYYVGQPTANLLPAAGGAIAGLATDTIGAGAGAGFGSALKSGLQNEFPKLFGEKPEDPLLDIGTDVVTQGLIPEGLGKAGALGMKQLAGRTIGNISRVTKSPSVISQVAREDAAAGLDKFGAQTSREVDHAAYNAKNNSNIPSEHAASGTVINDLRDLPRQTPFLEKPQEQSYRAIAKKALSDVSEVRNWKLATGESGTIRRIASDDLIRTGYSGDSKTLDVSRVLKSLDGPKSEVYAEALGQEGSASLRNFLSSAQSVSQNSSRSLTDKVLNYAKGRFLLSLPAAALGVATGHTLGGAGAVVLSDAAISLLMKDPEVAQIASQAFRKNVRAPDASLMNKVIVNALRGAEVYYTSPENKLEKAYLTEAGTITTMKPNTTR